MRFQNKTLAAFALVGALVLPATVHAAASSDDNAMEMHMGSAEAKDKKAEIQMDYLEHRGERRYIDLYNIHAFRQYKEMHGMSLHWGVTVSRAVGSWAEKDTPDVRLDSSAVGAGPAYMIRWTKPLGSKWEASLDATGAVLVYNDMHPAHTRNYGFMWRIGPRVTYKFNDRNALSVAYLGHHVSNGQRTRNPGYNGVGFSIGYRYSY